MRESPRSIEPTTAFRRDFKRESKGGGWNDCRECHIRRDLLLVYRKPDDTRLQLVRLGSHSELFG